MVPGSATLQEMHGSSALFSQSGMSQIVNDDLSDSNVVPMLRFCFGGRPIMNLPVRPDRNIALCMRYAASELGLKLGLPAGREIMFASQGRIFTESTKLEAGQLRIVEMFTVPPTELSNGYVRTALEEDRLSFPFQGTYYRELRNEPPQPGYHLVPPPKLEDFPPGEKYYIEVHNMVDGPGSSSYTFHATCAHRYRDPAALSVLDIRRCLAEERQCAVRALQLYECCGGDMPADPQYLWDMLILPHAAQVSFLQLTIPMSQYSKDPEYVPQFETNSDGEESELPGLVASSSESGDAGGINSDGFDSSSEDECFEDYIQRLGPGCRDR